MKDLLSFCALTVIIFSKVLGAFLILISLILTMTYLYLAGMKNPELIDAFQWAEFRDRAASGAGLAGLGLTLVPALMGVWLLKLPTLKRWEGPAVKDRVGDFR